MIEWDRAAVQRKFECTLAHTNIDGKTIGWTPIRTVTEDGYIYGLNKVLLGKVYTEVDQTGDDLPAVTFNYEPLVCGWYASKNNPNIFYLVERLNKKSWKIGLSDSAYSINSFSDGNGLVLPPSFTVWASDIDLCKPISTFRGVYLDILTSVVSRWKTVLQIYSHPIGHVFGEKLILNNPKYQSLVDKFLENRWQIVNL